MYKRLAGPKVVKRKVIIHVPTDGDGFQKCSMFMLFEVKPRAEIEDLQAKFDAGDPDTDWLNDVIKGWDHYNEDDGKTPIEFSAHELKLFLDVPYNRIAAIQEYFNTANGGLGRRKNS
jgi:hypothetical protein